MINVTSTGDNKLALEFRTKAELIPGQIGKAVSHSAQVIKAAILARASGRPGPNEVTGKYKNSWGIMNRFMGPSAQAEIGTHEPYGFRLEKGYHDTDSLGHNYDQPPYPHVEPGVGDALPTVMITLEKVAEL